MTLVEHNPSALPPLDRSLVKALRKLFPSERISEEPVDRMTYAYDATRHHFPPQVVIWPETAVEISAVMKLANEYRTPVYPRGGGTGHTGGALALQGGILLSLERMGAILLIDKANRLVTAQPGIPLGALKSAVQKEGLFYPPDPSSAKTALLGGTLAECAGGLNCVKYGTTKDWVQSVEAVLPNGEIVHLGTKARKNVVGYNLLQLVIGSEGTLAVITEATLRLIPYPTQRATFIALFDSVTDSAHAVQAMLESGVTPCALEFIDRESLEVANAYHPDARIPVTEALLLVETDGFAEKDVRGDLQTLAETCRQHHAAQVIVSATDTEREQLWEIRRTLSPAMFAKAPFKTNEDVCVPISAFSQMLEEAYRIQRKYNVITLCFGHAGDGNLHVNFMSHDEHDPQVEQAVSELFQKAVALEGSISGEHGIGITKAPYIALELGEQERRLLVEIKRVFDPNNILNPGKIVVPDCKEG